MHIFPGHVYISEDSTFEITEKNRESYLTSKTDFLNIGTYSFIANDTFFRCFNTVPANKLASNTFPVAEVPIHNILPELAEEDMTVKTITVLMQLSPPEYSILASAKMQSLSGTTVQLPNDKTLADLVKSADFIMTDVPEVAHTKGLVSHLKTWLGDEFSVKYTEAAVGDRKICRYATSRPDLCFFHTNKFYQKSTIIALASSCLETETEPESYGRMGGEDKLNNSGCGEEQTVAAMILVAATVAKKAIIEGNFFNKAIIFGLKREDGNDKTLLYKLVMDFMKQKSNLYKGRELMSTAKCLLSIKHLLENPESIFP